VGFHRGVWLSGWGKLNAQSRKQPKNVQFETPESPVITFLDRMVVLENLSVLRQEWEVAADGDSLINISASASSMLFDITTK